MDRGLKHLLKDGLTEAGHVHDGGAGPVEQGERIGAANLRHLRPNCRRLWSGMMVRERPADGNGSFVVSSRLSERRVSSILGTGKTSRGPAGVVILYQGTEGWGGTTPPGS